MESFGEKLAKEARKYCELKRSCQVEEIELGLKKLGFQDMKKYIYVKGGIETIKKEIEMKARSGAWYYTINIDFGKNGHAYWGSNFDFDEYASGVLEAIQTELPQDDILKISLVEMSAVEKKKREVIVEITWFLGYSNL